MGFYESISAYYDDLFPVSDAAVEFLDSLAKPEGRVLDIACGTGGHALGLSRLGHRVIGLDIDEAMIAAARQKRGQGEAEFVVGSMSSLADLPLAADFDLVYCLGNSLVHLDDDEQIGRVLKDILALLVPGGRMALQIVNYDRILRERVMELPPIRSETDDAGAARRLDFLRTYDYRPGDSHVQFITELTVQDERGNRNVKNSIPLLILTSADLVALASQAGFSEIDLYGNFAGGSLTMDSFPAILTARRA